MKWKNFEKKSIAFRWLAAYILVIFICILFAVAFFGVARNRLVRENSEFNRYVAAGVSSNIKDILVSMRKTYFDIQNSEYISSVLNISDSSQYRTDKAANKFVMELNDMGIYKNNIDFYYIYVPETDVIVFEGGVVNCKRFYDAYIREATYEQWIERLNTAKSGSCYSSHLQSTAGEFDAIACNFILSSSEPGNINVKKAVICINTRMERFFDCFEQIGWVNQSDLFIFDRDGKLILSRISSENKDNPADFTDFVSKENKKVRIIEAIEFDTVQLRMGMVMHRNAVYSSIENLHLIFFIIMLIMLIVVFSIVAVLIKQNYKPLAEIMGMFGLSDKNNEYDLIKENIRSMSLSNIELKDVSKKQKDKIRLTELGNMLKGRYSEADMKDILEKYNISFSRECFVVYVFHVLDYKNMKGYEELTESEKFMEVCFIVRNVLEELLGFSDSIAYVTEINGDISAVVNFNAGVINQIEQNLEYGLNIISEEFGIYISYAASDTHYRIGELGAAYREAMHTQEYKEVFSDKKNLRYMDINRGEERGKYVFGIKEEQSLIAGITSGDYQSCRKQLYELYNSIMEDTGLTTSMAKCMMFDIAAVLLKIPYDNNRENGGSKPDFDSLLKNCNSLENMFESVLDIIREMCMSFKENRHNSLADEIAEYIDKNFAESSLCTAQLADIFDLNDMYMLRLFKNEKGISMADYINHLRIGKAKSLIAETDMAISQIAETVGYTNIRTFNRLFKKAENITPVQYRAIYKNKT